MGACDFFTSTKEVMFYSAFVRLCVCLSVCLSVGAASHENYWSDLYENFTRDVSVTMKNWLHFGYLDGYLNDSSVLRDGDFSANRLIFLEKLIRPS